MHSFIYLSMYWFIHLLRDPLPAKHLEEQTGTKTYDGAGRVAEQGGRTLSKATDLWCRKGGWKEWGGVSRLLICGAGRVAEKSSTRSHLTCQNHLFIIVLIYIICARVFQKFPVSSHTFQYNVNIFQSIPSIPHVPITTSFDGHVRRRKRRRGWDDWEEQAKQAAAKASTQNASIMRLGRHSWWRRVRRGHGSKFYKMARWFCHCLPSTIQFHGYIFSAHTHVWIHKSMVVWLEKVGIVPTLNRSAVDETVDVQPRTAKCCRGRCCSLHALFPLLDRQTERIFEDVIQFSHIAVL